MAANEGSKLLDGGNWLRKHGIRISGHCAIGTILLPTAVFPTGTLGRLVKIDGVVPDGIGKPVETPEHLAIGNQPHRNGITDVDHCQALQRLLFQFPHAANQLLLGQSGQVAVIVQGNRHLIPFFQEAAQIHVPPTTPGDKTDQPREIHHAVDSNTHAYEPVPGGGHLGQQPVHRLAHLVIHAEEILTLGGELLPGQHGFPREVRQDGLHAADINV